MVSMKGRSAEKPWLCKNAAYISRLRNVWPGYKDGSKLLLIVSAIAV